MHIALGRIGRLQTENLLGGKFLGQWWVFLLRVFSSSSFSELAQQSIQPISHMAAVMGSTSRRSLRLAIGLFHRGVWVAPNRETHAMPLNIDVSTICIYNLCTNSNELLFLCYSVDRFLCCTLGLVLPQYSRCGEDYRQCEQAEYYGCLAYSPGRVVQE